MQLVNLFITDLGKFYRVVLTEIILKRPLFYTEGVKSSDDQLQGIFAYLGSPTREDLKAMHVAPSRKWKRHPSTRTLTLKETFSRSPAVSQGRDLSVLLHIIGILPILHKILFDSLVMTHEFYFFILIFIF